MTEGMIPRHLNMGKSVVGKRASAVRCEAANREIFRFGESSNSDNLGPPSKKPKRVQRNVEDAL